MKNKIKIIGLIIFIIIFSFAVSDLILDLIKEKKSSFHKESRQEYLEHLNKNPPGWLGVYWFPYFIEWGFWRGVIILLGIWVFYRIWLKIPTEKFVNKQ